MFIKEKLLVLKTETHELRKKFFRLTGRCIFGAQYEIQFSCKTRSDKDKFQRLLRSQVLAIPFPKSELGGHPRPVKKRAARYGRKRGGGIEEIKISQTM
ncbi:hypothetical protein AMTRI_Chr12g269670 [Amborella trichopoda]